MLLCDITTGFLAGRPLAPLAPPLAGVPAPLLAPLLAPLPPPRPLAPLVGLAGGASTDIMSSSSLSELYLLTKNGC